MQQRQTKINAKDHDGSDFSCEESKGFGEDNYSLESSYDAQVADEFEVFEDYTIRQDRHSKLLNTFHQKAIKKLTKKPTAEFGSLLSIDNCSSSHNQL